MKMRTIVVIYVLAIVATVVVNGQRQRSQPSKDSIQLKDGLLQKCRPYVSNYGFYQAAQFCQDYCCGSCTNRYCCRNEDERLQSQSMCDNNYDDDPSLLPQKSQTCYSYTDSYDNIMMQVTCASGDFCSGICSNRRCGNQDYDWLDQSMCSNNVNPPVPPATATTDDPSVLTTTEEPWIVIDNSSLYMIGSSIVIIVLFLMVLMLLCKLNKMDKYIRKMRFQQQATSMRIKLNDEPPAYANYQTYRY